MNAFWLICLIGGVLALIAAWRNWDWFFGHRKAQFFVVFLGRPGARVAYAVLGSLLVAIGILWGASNDWSLRERKSTVVAVVGLFPGGDAPAVAASVAAPLDAQFEQIPWVERIVSESRGDGRYRARIVFSPKVDARQAHLDVQAAINAAYAFLPRTMETVTASVESDSSEKQDGKAVEIAVVRNSDEADGVALQEFARIVVSELVGRNAIFNPAPLDDQIAIAGVSPALVMRVNRHPAVRIIGAPPNGKPAHKAALRCAEIADSERRRRQDAGSFEIITLTAR